MSYHLPSAIDLSVAIQVCERNGEPEKAAKHRTRRDLYAPLHPKEKRQEAAMRAAETLRATARLCPDLAEDLNARAAALATEAKQLRAEIGAACAKIEAMRLP